LLEQLTENGILVGPIGDRFTQMLLKIQKIGGKITTEKIIPCVFVPLIGEHGWKEE